MNLQREDPADTDKALLAQLKHSLERPVSIRTRWVDPEHGESYEVMQGIDWPVMTADQAKAALVAIDAACAAAADRTLGALLAELWLATAKQSTTGDDQQALAGVYIRELRSWPGDIVQHVLRRAKRECRWWPPLADLCRDCASLARQRAWLRSTLEDRIAELQRPPAALPTLQAMPGSSAAKAGFWSIDGGRNVERLAALRGISYRQARGLLVYASPAELLDLEEAVRRMAAGEAQTETENTEGRT